jgi:hydrogenase/urease accessory protein HupE
MKSLAAKFLFALAFLGAFAVRADEYRPAYLELTQTGKETYDLLWKVPARNGEEKLAIHVRLPEGATDLQEPQVAFLGMHYMERRRIHQPGGLEGASISIDGLAGSGTEVLARVVLAGGATRVTRLLPGRPSFVVEATAGNFEVVRTYTGLGIEHILLGVDHLLFVLALLILVRGVRRIVLTVTAFTVAHSITLVAATLGWLSLPGPPVEAVIALSIVFLAREIAMSWRGTPGLTARRPWVVAFVFGLLHGLGFASALAEIGLPQNAIPLALLCFNLGVELGQLLFVAAVLGAAFALRNGLMARHLMMQRLAAYGIGSVASFWMIERIGAFWA